jgi:hypothetical protein
MKAIICVLAFVTVATVCRAEETTCSFSSLPPTVYLLTEPGVWVEPRLRAYSDAHEKASVYEIQRGDNKTLAIFCTARSAELFLAALADAKARNRYVSAVPKSFFLDQTFFLDLQKQGVSLLLDPKTPVEGGTLVVADPDNPELKTLCDEDQADRTPEEGKAIDWNLVGPRDVKRLARVKALYVDGKIDTASDYFRAALVLQHGAEPEDFLLAHEFAIVAVRKGYGGNAPWLVAASEDRFLQSIGRKQRFGTQLAEPIVVDGRITDRLRWELGVRSLAEEQGQAKASNRK